MRMNPHSLLPPRSSPARQGLGPALLALVSLLLLAGCATGSASGGARTGWLSPGAQPEAMGGSGDAAEDVWPCAPQALPPGWPDFSSDDSGALLAPFLSCSSPADFLALQERVDMPRLVARLDAWSAVRLGSLGPVREEAARPLNRQRASFLLRALERYGSANADVLALFVLDSSHDDDLRELLFLLAQDKQLVELLEQLPSLAPALEARGLKPSAHAERDFDWSDMGRGLDRAGKDALATSPLFNGLSSTLGEFTALQAQLPPPYQRALLAVEHAQFERQFAAGSLTLGFVDHMTFGVPLGFYGLVAGTGHGVYDLSQGRYEQATRELAPAVLLVSLYAGGRGASALSEGRGLSAVGVRALSGLEVMELRLRNLQSAALRLQGLLDPQSISELAQYIRASREAGRFVAVGGADAALALHEARGDVGRAQAMLSRARPGATGSSVGRGGAKTGSEVGATRANETARPAMRQGGVREYPATLAALADEQAGLTQEVVRVKLAVAEAESTSARLSTNVAALEKQRPSLEAPPPEAQGNPRWQEYVTYYEGRLTELKEGKAAKGPLSWEGYERLRGWFARGMEFERTMVRLLREDAHLPRSQRRFLGDFDKPRIETYVGVKKPGTGLRYADVLIIEEGRFSSGAPRVETLSFKSRDLADLDKNTLRAQMTEDAGEAMRKYGGALDIRRESLQPLLNKGSGVTIQRVRLVYEGGNLKPQKEDIFQEALEETRAALPEVEVLFQ